MKKRRLKKRVYTYFILFVLLIIGTLIVINLKDNGKKGVNNGDNAVNSGSNVNKDNKDDKNTEDKKKKMSLIAVGDVLIHESVYKDAYQKDGKYDFSKMFTDVEPIIKKYDFCR